MGEEMKLVIPVLPGKAEAWRRFLQELEGSKAAEFASWCQSLGVKIKKLRLHDSLGCALVLLTMEVGEPGDVARKLAQHQSLFNYWLMGQIRTLHGLDLTKLQRKGELS